MDSDSAVTQGTDSASHAGNNNVATAPNNAPAIPVFIGKPTGVAAAATSYALSGIVIFVGAVVLGMTVNYDSSIPDGSAPGDGSPWLWVMIVMGAVIIIALLSAAALPHLRKPH